MDDGNGFDLSRLDRSGFGVSGMQQRIRALHGTFSITSTPGEGTTVEAEVPTARFRLAIFKSALAPIEDHQRKFWRTMASLDPIRVLVVDDHPVVRMGLGSMLDSQKGISVVGMVASGREALLAWPALRPDVVLMDLRMPEMDGVDAIVALPCCDANIKILVLTNYQMDEDIFKALQAGALGYLVKSAHQEEIVTRFVPSIKESAVFPRLSLPSLPNEVPFSR